MMKMNKSNFQMLQILVLVLVIVVVGLVMNMQKNKNKEQYPNSGMISGAPLNGEGFTGCKGHKHEKDATGAV